MWWSENHFLGNSLKKAFISSNKEEKAEKEGQIDRDRVETLIYRILLSHFYTPATRQPSALISRSALHRHLLICEPSHLLER